MSSADDLDVRDPDHSLGDGLGESMISSGPFQNVQMSKAAQTHRLRRLRAPTKCRECDGLVVFQGAECEECSLACHKKCLEALSIQCGHKKLQGRLALFGEDFATVARGCPDGIPFIIRKCATEVESRALNLKGIYRVNGAKSRVEKLCQAFENGKELVELSDHSPHDISNVLKLYLRQLPEPLIQYRFYSDVIGIAKETQKIVMVEAANDQESSGETLNAEVHRVVLKMRDLLHKLPPTHYRTLHFLLAHLYRVSKHAEENKMSTSNLGIIFGPTLVRARQTAAEVSLSSLVDYPFQALAVELLIRYHDSILPLPLSLPAATSSPLAHLMLPHPHQQSLRRNSHSLLDIKEAQSSRGQHRYSCVVPETQQADGPHENSVLMSPGRSHVETLKSGGSNRSPVQMRASVALQQRLSPRPISMPVSVPITMPRDSPGSIHLLVPTPSQSTAQTQQQSLAHGSPPTHETGAGKGPRGTELGSPVAIHAHSPPRSGPGETPQLATDVQIDASVEDPTAYMQPDDRSTLMSDISCLVRPGQDAIDSGGIMTEYSTTSPTASPASVQVTVLDTQALRRTWEKEYRPPLLTPRTAMILARSSTDASPSFTTSSSLTFPSSYSITSTTASTTTTNVTTSSVSTMFPRSPYCVSVGSGGPPVAFRAPRTLHPPPGTFYRPHSQSPTAFDDSPASIPSSSPTSSSPTSATTFTSSSSITRQRLRSSLQELEPREAHFV